MIEKIEKTISNFDGNISLYANDNKGTIINFNENEVVETASCIKLFILIEYYKQILEGKKARNDFLTYEYDKYYMANGSGIIQYLDKLKLTSRNMAILMIIDSDNIATNIMIEYLGIENINNTIKSLGFKNTMLICPKLDFNIYKEIGKTTAKEYGELYIKLLNKEILKPEICEEILEILKNQLHNDLLIRKLPLQDLNEIGEENANIKYIASKSGGLGDKKYMIGNCRNDGGIIATKFGSYIVSIFINNFNDYYWNRDNKAILAGGEIHHIIYENYLNNNGKFIL